MGTAEIKQAKISLTRMRNDILLYGSICTALYIAFLFLMKLFNLVQVVELRFVNYLILFAVTMFELRRWVKVSHGYVPFLQVLGTALFTGMWSFILFCVFIYVYTRYDLEFAELFIQRAKGLFPSMPSLVILFEGSGASIIVAFIHMQYFRRFEEGESSPDL